MILQYTPYTLKFRFEAGTSRGVYTEKKTWFVHLTEDGSYSGVGECGPLKGLSIDDQDGIEGYLKKLSTKLKNIPPPNSHNACLSFAEELVEPEFPSIRFGLETALLDYLNQGNKVIFRNSFVKALKRIPINGLIWMGKKEAMIEQIKKKIEDGYSCLKIKIGAIDFLQECQVLKFIRSNFKEKELVLRVDANGAFSLEDAEEKLKVLSSFDIHSIEQPIKQGQIKELAALVKSNILPIALDEELIGIHKFSKKADLLDKINPPYIILKPTLLGGIKSCQEWIQLAEERNIGWWITSALESNIGLNSIAQFTAEYDIKIPQGLGTGQLYLNNIESPLEIEGGYLRYGEKQWNGV